MDTTSFQTRVETALAQAAPNGRYRYLLVDTAATQGHALIAGLPLAGACVDLLQAAPVDLRSSASPVLVPLSADAWSPHALAAWQRLSKQWRYAGALTYIESGTPFQPFMQALGIRCQAELPDDMTVLLRYFDNRVLHALLQHLTPIQQAVLLAPGERWVYADRWGEALEAAPVITVTEASAQPPLRLSAGQEAALLDDADADSVVDQLLNLRHPTLMTMLPPHQHQAVLRALHDAEGHGISGNTDRVAYCHLALALGAGFASQQPWQGAVEDARSGRRGFAEAVQLIADEEEQEGSA